MILKKQVKASCPIDMGETKKERKALFVTSMALFSCLLGKGFCIFI
jgi:hypothetical protein